MKVLITGYKGFLGKHICEKFRKEGVEYVGYDLKDGDDIFDIEKLTARMAGCDAVIHLAAYPSRESTNNPDEFERLNHQGSIVVYKCAKKAGVKRFVYTSSGNVYCWGDGIQDDKEPPYNVYDYPNPDMIHPYPRSKIMTERYLEEHKGEGMQIFILRPNCIAPTPEPYYTIYKKSTITLDRLARYFFNVATREKDIDFEIFDVIEPNEDFPASIRAQEEFD